jgi:arylsulfatase A-like enzyme
MEAVRKWIDGYDVGISYADTHVGRLLNALDEIGVLDDLVILVSADHGENQGELGVWGDHQTADHITCRVPLLVRWPGLTDGGRIDGGLCYQYDWAATMIELVGGQVPANWDGRSFAEAFRSGQEQGRDYLVLSQNAWSCQRGVRFGDHVCLRTYHDGYKPLEPVMLFDLSQDPHEQQNLAGVEEGIVNEAMAKLAAWHHEMTLTSRRDVDPMATVLREGGAFHTRGKLPVYLDRLCNTGRAHHAKRLADLHPDEL